MSLELTATEVSRRDLAAVLPPGYTPLTDDEAAAAAKTPGKLRRQVAAAASPTREGAATGGVVAQSASAAGVSLRTNVLDSLSILETIEEDTMTRIRAVRRRANDGNQTSLKELITFDDEFLYTTKVGFGVDRLVRENNLDLNLEWLESFGTPITTPDSSAWDDTLTNLLVQLVPKGGFDEFRQKMRMNVTRPLFPFGDADVPDLLLNMNMFSLTDVMGATRTSLKNSQQDIESYEDSVTEGMSEFEEFKRKEQFEEAAVKSDDVLALRGKKLDIAVKRMKQLSTGDVQSGGLLARLDAILKAPGIPKLMEEKKDLRTRTLVDVSTIEADRTKRLKRNESAIASYNDRVAESRHSLKKNFKEQDAVWADIEVLIAKVKDLGDESRHIVSEHMVMTEIEQKRRKEFSEYKESYATHHNILDELLKNCHTGLQFLDDVQAYLHKGRQIIADIKAEEQLMELLVREKKQFSKCFYQFAEHCGRSMERVSVRVVGLDRMLRTLKFQQSQAAAVDDTDFASYALQINTMENNLKKLTKKRDKVQVEFDRREDQFLDIWEQSETVDADEDEGDHDEQPDAAEPGSPSSTKDPLLKVKKLIADIRSRYVDEISSLVKADDSDLQRRKDAAHELAESVEKLKASPKKKKTPPTDDDDGQQQPVGEEGVPST